MNRIAHTKRLTALAAAACFVVVTMVGGAEAAAPADSQAPPPIAATCVAGTAENPLDQTDESMQACMMAQIGLVASPNPTPPGGVVSFTWSVSPATDCWDNLGNSAWGNYSFSRAVNSSFTWTVYCTGNGVESNSLNIVVSNPTDPPPPPPGGGYVPALTSPPTISGTTEVGNTLAANRGSWTNSPTSYSYAWRRSGDLQQLGSGSALALTSAHVGYQIRVDVMACNGTGCSSWASSGWTATVSQPPPPPVYACSNGWDDDGDGKVDYPNDPGCISSTDNDEYNAPSTATLTAYPTSITAGSSSTLTWSSSSATSCSASWTSSTARSGSATVWPSATTTYSITCSGAIATARVTVTASWLDSDGDGVSDSTDNCPADYNPGQENGDGDSKGDACDIDMPLYDGGGYWTSTDAGWETSGGSHQSVTCRKKIQEVTRTFTQAGLYDVIRWKGGFQVCYQPGGSIVWVRNVWGDAYWTGRGWSWRGIASGYPKVLIYSNRVVVQYRGTAAICIFKYGCGPEKYPWVTVTFYNNNSMVVNSGVA
mgnify:CR=1 FL=1